MQRLVRVPLLFVLTATVFGQAPKSPAPKSISPEHAKQIKQGLALFEQDVRSVLIKHCLECHGGKFVKSEFDLSTRSRLMKSGFVEKTAAESHLMALISHSETPHMPFKKPKLPPETIAAIGKWIDLGAPYDKPLVEGRDEAGERIITDADRRFWSFQAIQVAKTPDVKNSDWCRSPIDNFVLSRQEQAGLRPNSTTSARKLIRRVYFDLIGLPPSPQEMEHWLARLTTGSPLNEKAYGELLDELMNSQHYGERWARHWLDVARFAESHGYEQDYDRPHAYHYRDFLIKALNQDMPFNQMISWQLAGDELAPQDALAMTATGFLGGGVFPTQLTETEFESARYDEIDDMLATTGVAFLGLSIGCARCHDHKFDPIPTRDYYRMAATFTTTIRSEIDIEIDAQENRERRAAHDAKVADAALKLQDAKHALSPKFLDWLAGFQPTDDVDPWSTLRVKRVTSSGGTKFQIEPDQTVMATSAAPPQEVITIEAETTLAKLAAVRLEALTHASFPRKGPGRADNGNFALGDFRVDVAPQSPNANSSTVKFAAARATHQQNTSTLSVAASIDADPISGWAVDVGGIGKDQAAVFDADRIHASPDGMKVTVTLTLNHPNKKHTLGRFRLSVAEQAGLKPKVGRDGLDPEILKLLVELKSNIKALRSTDAALAKPLQDKLNRAVAWFSPRDPEWNRLNNELAKLKANGPKLDKVKAQVSSEGFPHMKHHADGRGYPHFYKETHLLNRGDVKQKVEAVTPSFLRVLMAPGKKNAYWQVKPPSGWTRTSFRRASLANWITDTEHGAGQLAARVAVNRLWQHHFDRGIVATPNDFGVPGDRPTHPELLDWLAAKLIQFDWKLKPIHKLIMTSSVYMQSGEFDEARAKLDRENRLLWRRTPRRLEAEAIRDSTLAVSGQLNRTLYGPGTLDPNTKRRSIYFFIKRSKLIPMMMLFDWPEHLVSIGARANTTIAPQALMFMNSPQGRQYADAFAKEIAQGSPQRSVAAAYALAFGRPPLDRELQLSVAFLKQQEASYAKSNPANSHQLALTDFSQIVLGMNEFVYVD
ncbi:MAG: DUF1553 domain-containing protein [Planctomycetota bacterium]|nr:DUF1553 domain-containing protein [Planctomycetota bacterium]